MELLINEAETDNCTMDILCNLSSFHSNTHFVVCPVDEAVHGIKVHGHGMLHSGDRDHDGRVVRRVQGDPSDVCPPCQNQHLLWT